MKTKTPEEIALLNRVIDDPMACERLTNHMQKAVTLLAESEVPMLEQIIESVKVVGTKFDAEAVEFVKATMPAELTARYEVSVQNQLAFMEMLVRLQPTIQAAFEEWRKGCYQRQEEVK